MWEGDGTALVSLATCVGLDGSTPGGNKRFHLLHSIDTGAGPTRGFFSEVKATGTWR